MAARQPGALAELDGDVSMWQLSALWHTVVLVDRHYV